MTKTVKEVLSTGKKGGRKTCTKCREIKEFSEFYISRKKRDGLRSACKLCDAKSFKKWSADNRAKS